MRGVRCQHLYRRPTGLVRGHGYRHIIILFSGILIKVQQISCHLINYHNLTEFTRRNIVFTMFSA